MDSFYGRHFLRRLLLPLARSSAVTLHGHTELQLLRNPIDELLLSCHGCNNSHDLRKVVKYCIFSNTHRHVFAALTLLTILSIMPISIFALDLDLPEPWWDDSNNSSRSSDENSIGKDKKKKRDPSADDEQHCGESPSKTLTTTSDNSEDPCATSTHDASEEECYARPSSDNEEHE